MQTSNSSAILQAQGIEKSFGKLEVLKGIDIHVSDNEMLAIMGKSGSGKSTLLHIMGTLSTPDKGELLIQQKNPFKYSNKKLAEFRNQHIGFVFQFHHLLEEFTAEENVLLASYLHDRSKIRVKERLDYLFDYLGISDRKHHKPSELSGGEQQRVAIIRALINEPEIVFADEPTGNLDHGNSQELHELFLQLKEQMNQTFVFVTHHEELASICDRICVLQDGVIIESDDRTE